MKEKSIEHIVHRLSEYKKSTGNGAIVLLGAGCSISGGIPSAGKLVKEVLEMHKNNPDIKQICEQDPTYAQLMTCLESSDRRSIFEHYVKKEAKINATHIYLAQLVDNGFVDYITTVNFDNLAQRALALYNIFPPVYDISDIARLTDDALHKGSIIHLHGRYDGFWQLNTQSEMQKVIDSGTVKSIFDKIGQGRPWIVIGYSGDDPIFEVLKKFDRFGNGLFWNIHEEKADSPSENVRDFLVHLTNQAYVVKGGDSDAFFMELSVKLCSDQPKIFNSPFRFLSDLYGKIKDIEDSDKYRSVKERFEDSKKKVADAIQRYEVKDDSANQMTEDDIRFSHIKQQLIDCLVNDNYDALENLEQEILELKDPDLLSLLSSPYYNWGNHLGTLAEVKTEEEKENLLLESCKKFETAIKYKKDFPEVYNNWGNRLADLAELKTDTEKEKLFLESCKKFETAIKYKKGFSEAYNNWGNVLYKLAKLQTDTEELLIESCKKYETALHYKKDDYEVLYNWGINLFALAELSTGIEKEKLLLESCKKYEAAIHYKKDYFKAYSNWAINLTKLGCLKSGSEKEMLLQLALEKSKRSKEFGGKGYNLACAYALLGQKDDALLALKESLEKGEIDFAHIQQDSDWDDLRTEPEYLELIAQYEK